MRVPRKIKAELEALIMLLESKGARGLTDTMCVVPVINTSGSDEYRWAVAMSPSPGVFVPFAFLGTTVGQWDVALKMVQDPEDEESPTEIEPYFVKDPSKTDVMAAIPKDALPAYQDEDLLCTDEDVDDDAWDEEML
jgi:hypothetical protein